MHLVISMINARANTGPFTVFRLFCEAASRIPSVKTTVLCHKLEDMKCIDAQNVEYIEYPLSRKSWLFRCYYEYVYFRHLAKRIKPDYWLSLHDMTPNLGGFCPQSVYCHNPTPFYEAKLRDLYFSPSVFLFALFYKYLYGINIKKNKYIIVQQEWIRKKFIKMFDSNNVMVSLPLTNTSPYFLECEKKGVVRGRFVYASRPRPFKNFEIICEAAQILCKNGVKDIEFILTIDKSENKYARYIANKYKKCPLLNFVGCLDQKSLYEYYASSDAMIFPSKLETWGLGISEFKSFDRPIFIADLEYAHETLGEYSKSIVFNPDDPQDLADKILGYLDGSLKTAYHQKTVYGHPFENSISGTLNFLLKDFL